MYYHHCRYSRAMKFKYENQAHTYIHIFSSDTWSDWFIYWLIYIL